VRRRPARLEVWGFAVLAAGLAGSSAAVLGVTAWPEIVTPAYFVSRGLVLYRDVFFPHAPLLILATAFLGWMAGFSAGLFRLVVGVAIGATAGLLVADAGLRRSRGTAALACLAAPPLLVAWVVYTEGPALWPDPVLAPLLLLAALLLERFERRGHRRDLILGFLVLGTAILVKQTSAWAGLAALLWLLVRSRRRDGRNVVLCALLLAAPYGAFGLLWGLAFRTTTHLYWTLVVPLVYGATGEVATPPDLATVHEALVLFLGLAALALLARVLPAGRRLRSPVGWVALGAAAMAWPRADLLHLAGLAGLVTLTLLRGGALAAFLARRLRRRSASRVRIVSFAAGTALIATALGVAFLGAGPLALDQAGRRVYYWDDDRTVREAQDARGHVPADGELLLYGVRNENLYPILGARFPGGLYVNTGFWYCLDKRGADERVVEALRARPGLPVFFQEPAPEAVQARRTALYRYVVSHTVVDEVVDGRASWRRVR